MINKQNTDIDILSNYINYSKTDLNGVITEVSDVFCKCSQYKREELIGKTHNIVRHPDIPSSIYKQMWETIQSGQVWNGNVKNKSKDGTFCWNHTNIIPQYDKNDKIIGYMAIRNSVTELFKKEIQLFEQSKMAVMGSMIDNIIHQWRQPLSIISTIASNVSIECEYDMLKIDKLPKSMDDIVCKTNYLSDVIDTFRNYLRKDKVVKETILQKSITASLSLIHSVLHDSNIRLENNVDYKNPISIFLVESELIEVLINIINNAKDALIETNVKDPWIKLCLEQKDQKIIISIEDNAKGIPLNIIDKIFNQHFTTKDKKDGTGLGLHMSYQIVTNSLKGDLYVKNTLHGAKFFIEIPLFTCMLKDK